MFSSFSFIDTSAIWSLEEVLIYWICISVKDGLLDFVCKDRYIFRVEIEHIVDIKIGTASGNYLAAPGRTESIVDKEKKEEISCIDVFVEEKKQWMEPYQCSQKQSKDDQGNTSYYQHLEGTADEIKQIEKKCKKWFYKYRIYSKRWDRSADYRKVFFENTKGPYECRYCHKRISRKYMQIDHIVPVLQAKKNPRARNILKRMHAESVNDLVNLAPCCSRCNRQKGSKMGIWVLKGCFGDKGWFRALEKIMICVLLFLVFVAVTGTIHYLIK